MKTTWALSRAAFFYLWPLPRFPSGDRRLIALERAPFGFLWGPPELMEEPAHMIG